jgi:hypothetical protein
MRPSILVLTKPVKVGATSFESPVLMTGGLRVGLVIEGRTSEIQSKASQNDGSRFLQSLPQRRIVLERFVAYLFINCECAQGWDERLPEEWTSVWTCKIMSKPSMIACQWLVSPLSALYVTSYAKPK